MSPAGAPPSRRRVLTGLAGVAGLAGAAGIAAACSPSTPPVASARPTTLAGTPGRSTGPGDSTAVSSTTTAAGNTASTSSTAPTAGTASTAGTDTAPSTGTLPSSPGVGSISGRVTPADWRALAAGLRGSLLQPGQGGFTAASHVYNTRFDAVTPAGIVRCADPADVVAAVTFARRFGLRAVAKAGGHGYLGSATVAQGLVIDTGAMAGVSYDGASGTAAVGAGARLVDVYNGLAAHGRSVPGGSCPAVGMGGHVLGGGLGVVSNAHGLACDAVRAIDVVTADGRYRTVSAAREPDLFWALRGGGGGTVGIATAFHVQPFPTSDCGLFFASWPWAAVARVVAGWQRRVAVMPDSAWCNLHLDVRPGKQSVSVAGVSLTGSAAADAAALVAAVGVEPSSLSSRSASYLQTMLVEAGCSRIGFQGCHLTPAGSLPRQGFLAGSTVVGRQLPAAGIARLVGAVTAGASTGLEVAAVCDPLGGATRRVPAAATSFPWRGAAFSVQWYAGLTTPAPASSVGRAQSWVTASRRAMGAWAAGAYVNYPDASVTRPADFHGATTARLTGILRRYDPTGFFTGPGRLPV